MASFGRDQVAALLGQDVSRETVERLGIHVALLHKWQKAINLVAPSTLAQAWTRHVQDSAQLAHLAQGDVWLDLGSGAGFPGLVLAILGAGREHHLVESDARKCVFLQEVARETGTQVHVHRSRVEALAAFPADVVTARALAPLPQLIQYSVPFLHPGTIMLFSKGAEASRELTQAQAAWTLDADLVPSITDPEAAIVRIKGAVHV
ncbi:16S rRNA (guanine(527)-N(7))-methyltransferase RsmG [Zavarzinia sp. CC-PAN008]|uniref:16S rRNA (guanine(527)-N(7))-methyltransferase RsmG n=1 Tax=Zavarzinia sp. CC-PAN008 TaxID=3243332 RepID=UPI003F746127